MHHLDEEETDILQPLQLKLDEKTQLELAEQFIAAGDIASKQPHPELSKNADKAPRENIQIGLAEKR